MSFTEYAASLLRNNRRLKNNISQKSAFRNQYYKKDLKSTFSKTYFQLSLDSIKRSDSIRKNRLIRQFFTISVLSIIFLIALLYFGAKAVENYQVYYANQIEMIKEDAAFNRKISSYHSMVNNGYLALESQLFIASQRHFQQALNLFPRGKKANYGMTKSLQMRCAYTGSYCDLAHKYFTRIQKSDAFNLQQKNELKEVS